VYVSYEHIPHHSDITLQIFTRLPFIIIPDLVLIFQNTTVHEHNQQFYEYACIFSHLNYFYNRFLTKSIDSIGEGSIPEIVARYIDE